MISFQENLLMFVEKLGANILKFEFQYLIYVFHSLFLSFSFGVLLALWLSFFCSKHFH